MAEASRSESPSTEFSVPKESVKPAVETIQAKAPTAALRDELHTMAASAWTGPEADDGQGDCIQTTFDEWLQATGAGCTLEQTRGSLEGVCPSVNTLNTRAEHTQPRTRSLSASTPTHHPSHLPCCECIALQCCGSRRVRRGGSARWWTK